MKTFNLYNDAVICECLVQEKIEKTVGNFTYAEVNMPIYKVVNSSNTSKFAVGDKIICSVNGKANDFDGKILYMFKFENIIAKVK